MLIAFLILNAAVLGVWILRAQERAVPRKAAKNLWHRVFWQLSARLPEAFACNGIPTPDIDDAFAILYAAKKLMREAT